MEGFTLADLKKRYEKDIKKKNYRGWYEATKQNAGNVPLNNAIFNMVMGSAKSVDMAQVNADNFIGDAPATADGGIGMVSMAESAGSSPEYVIWVKEGEAWKPWGGCSGGRKSFLEDPEHAKQWLEDASKKNKTQYTELKILENGDNSLEEDFHNLSQILKIIFDDGDYLVTRFKGTLKDAKDHFIGNTFDFDGSTKKGTSVRLMPVSSHVAEDLIEDIDKSELKENKDWKEKVVSVRKGKGKIVKMQNISASQNDRDYYILFDAKGEYVDKSLDFNKLKDKLYEGFNGDETELRKRIENLKDDEVLRLENRHNTQVTEEPLTLCIKKNKKFPGKYILWNEGQKSGDKLNLVNFSSLDNAVECANKQDKFLDEKLLKESFKLNEEENLDFETLTKKLEDIKDELLDLAASKSLEDYLSKESPLVDKENLRKKLWAPGFANPTWEEVKKELTDVLAEMKDHTRTQLGYLHAQSHIHN